MTTSDRVAAFYERMPYPPPLTSLDEHRELYQNPLRRRALWHRMWPTEQPRHEQAILVAGCGTSQAARYAMRERDAFVVGIDVSAASLAETRQLQQRYDLENLELHQLAIEDAGQLGRRFDMIVCTGVLHHLPDPDIGLRALHDVLKPHGALQVMVYAAYGRAGIYMMQEYCRLLGVGSTPDELRDLAGALEVLPASHAMGTVLRGWRDFCHPETLADALLHPMDRAFTVPAFLAWLARAELRFGRWVEQAPYLPQCGLLAQSPHAARIAALPAPEQHAAVELFRGTMVSHSAIVYRAEMAGACQPIAFDDDRWRSFVPLLLPWTMRIKERLPEGSAAVLINPAHTFPDLVLPIDHAQASVLDLVDGERTMAELLASEAGDQMGALALRQFFERLWRHDQVVFDASASARSPR